jgi:hypothetical protein
MVDDEPGRLEPPNALGKHAEPIEVADVEHDQQIDSRKRLGALAARLDDVVTEQKIEQRRPGSRVHDLDGHLALREEPGQGRLGTASITVGVDVCRQCDTSSGGEMRREPVDSVASIGGNGEEVGGAQNGLRRLADKANGARCAGAAPR